jgi:tRNA1(Val) A37 N6-methylase TrmN6
VTEHLTDDHLLGGRLRFSQPARGYRIAIDPVLLAAAMPARAGERVLDAGAGTGAASLCLAARVPECRIVGLELQRPADRGQLRPRDDQSTPSHGVRHQPVARS